MRSGRGTTPIDSRILLELISVRMPFGKYKNRVLCDLPGPYLVWLSRKGYPPGRIGTLLSVLYEVKLNGLEHLLTAIRERNS